MPFLERTLEFLGYVDLEKTRILKPRSSIFVCGGKIDEDLTKSHSVRDILLKRLPDRNKIDDISIILAEKAKDALANSNFENLLDMEECIASVVDAILLIVESPGSVCELGAFTKIDEARRKLVVIVPNEHSNTPSFITLGPIQYIEQKADGGVVEPVHWTQPPTSIDELGTTEIINVCKAQVASNFYKKEIISPTDVGHRIIVILAICHLLRGPKIGEIKQCMDALGLPTPEGTIRKYIDTLEVCDLIKTARYTKKFIHYVPQTSRVVLDFAFRAGTPDADRNALRWIDRIKEDIETEEPKRLDIFQRHNDAA